MTRVKIFNAVREGSACIRREHGCVDGAAALARLGVYSCVPVSLVGEGMVQS